MGLRKVNVGKEFKNPFGNNNKPRDIRAFKTMTMFKNIDDLNKQAEYLRSKKYEVIVNEKLLKLQYR